MQPCQVCGGMAIDPNGYCTQCGTFRGQVTQPVSGGAPYPPQQGGYPYPGQPPASPAPYPGPASPAPYPGQPSGAPYPGPASGAPYPFSGPPISGSPGYPQPPGRRSYTGVLIASSAVLIVLIAAIIVVAIVRSPGHNTAGGDGTPTPTGSPAPSALIDSCLIGTWQATSDREQLDIPGVGPITVVGSGVVTHVHPDGTVDEDYAQAKPYKAQYNGHALEIIVSGTNHYTITTANNTITFHNVKPDGTETAKVDGSQVGSAVPLEPSTDPVQYTCANNTATENTTQYDLTLNRTSPTP
jgi:hypothetical protein